MRLTQKIIPTFCILTFAISACNIGVSAPSSISPQQAAGTIVAATLQAQGLPTAGLIANSPTAASASPIASPALTLTASVTVTITATPGKVTLTIDQNSNCREGPSQNFKVVTAFVPGTKLDILGKDSANNFWLVKIPNSEETCWVWGQYATPSGDVDAVEEVTPEASAQTVPARPGSLFYNYFCSAGSLNTTLTWSDIANNETGYHVYRDGTLIADLPANATSYSDTTPYSGGSVSFSVEAYNDTGTSQQRTVTFTCQ
jgi:hypothetical protein